MSSSRLRRWLLAAVGVALLAGVVVMVNPARASAADNEITRKVKSKVPPAYPDIARRMNISGVVRLVVVVSPNGLVKSTKAIGGHPLLVSAAEEAVKKWKFESAPEENSGVVEFTFKPDN